MKAYNAPDPTTAVDSPSCTQQQLQQLVREGVEALKSARHAREMARGSREHKQDNWVYVSRNEGERKAKVKRENAEAGLAAATAATTAKSRTSNFLTTDAGYWPDWLQRRGL